MKDLKRIMACVDLSEFSRETTEYALALARGEMTKVVLFNVINSRDIEAIKTVSPLIPDLINSENYIEREKAERQRLIEEMVEKHFLGDKERLEILVHVGIPYRAILEAIKKESIDLVVIASKGRSNLIGTLHGSNAEKVFRHSPVPVLSVRNRTLFGRNL